MTDIPSTDWSQTDDSNTGTPPAGAPEGMSPGKVNDTLRAMMGAVKRWYAWSIPATTSGTSTAYTITYSVAPGALVDGMTFLVSFDQACGSSPTLNVNSLGAKTLQKYVGSSWSDVAAGDIQADQILRVTYNSTAGKFRVISPLNVVPTGTSLPFRGTSSQVPSGFVLEAGGTIGDSSSGGTARAADDCEALFKLLWSNSNYTLQDSSGTTTTKGATADADWTAHKRLILSDMTNKFRRGASTTPGGTGGADTHTHTYSDSDISVSVAGTTAGPNAGTLNVGNQGTQIAVNATLHTHNFTGTGTASTSGTTSSGSNVPSYVYELSIIKL